MSLIKYKVLETKKMSADRDYFTTAGENLTTTIEAVFPDEYSVVNGWAQFIVFQTTTPVTVMQDGLPVATTSPKLAVAGGTYTVPNSLIAAVITHIQFQAEKLIGAEIYRFESEKQLFPRIGTSITGVTGSAETLAGVYVTEGTMTAYVDGRMTTHSTSTDHDGRYFSKTELSATDGVGGSNLIGTPAIPGVAGTKIKDQLASLKTSLDGVVLGQIPDRSLSAIKIALGAITTAELAFDPATQAELDAHLADYTLQVPYAGTTTGTANTYAIATPTITALTAGMAVSVKINLDSTGASTLDWNGKGAKGVKKANGTDATLKATGIYTLRYDGTNFILQGEGASGNATASDLLSGKTAGTDAGDIVGTMINKVGSATVITPTVTEQAIPGGYYDGVLTSGKVGALPSNIKSIQRGTSYFTTAAIIVAISSIDINSSIVEVSARGKAANSTGTPASTMVSAKINSATQLQFETCLFDSNVAPYFAYVVTEFNNVKSKQSGTKQCVATGVNAVETYTQAITGVNASKSILEWSMRTDLTSEIAERMIVRVQLSNSQITIDLVTTAASNYYIEWQVLELN